MKTKLMAGVLLAVCAAGAAHAGDTFERKAGLWKITRQSASGRQGPSAQLCLAADTDALLARREAATMKSLCSKLEHRREGATFVTDSVCTIGSHASSSHTVITPSGDDAYRMVITNQEGKESVQEGHRAGACPAGMKPGDQILNVGPQMPQGIKMNLLDAKAMP